MNYIQGTGVDFVTYEGAGDADRESDFGNW